MRLFGQKNESVAKKLNEKLDEIWGVEFTPDDDVYVPLYFPEPSICDLMFVGMNPSFPTKDLQKWLDQIDPGLGNVEDYFAWKNRSAFDVGHSLRVDELARDQYAYFKHFRALADDLNASWGHLDLFQFRGTKQYKLNDELKVRSEWKSRQIECFAEALPLFKPRIIVVANAAASGHFIERFGSVFDERVGFHHTILNNRKVPTFFSGMLTGQRALDVYNRDRLVWHIKRAWKS